MPSAPRRARPARVGSRGLRGRAGLQVGRLPRHQCQCEPLRRPQVRGPAHPHGQAGSGRRQGARGLCRQSQSRPRDAGHASAPRSRGAGHRMVQRARGCRQHDRRVSGGARCAAAVDRGAACAAEAARLARHDRLPGRCLRGQPARRATGDREARAALARRRPRPRRGGSRGGRRRALRHLRAVRGLARGRPRAHAAHPALARGRRRRHHASGVAAVGGRARTGGRGHAGARRHVGGIGGEGRARVGQAAAGAGARRAARASRVDRAAAARDRAPRCAGQGHRPRHRCGTSSPPRDWHSPASRWRRCRCPRPVA